MSEKSSDCDRAAFRTRDAPDKLRMLLSLSQPPLLIARPLPLAPRYAATSSIRMMDEITGGSSIVVGLPLLLIVGFLKLARFEPTPNAVQDPNAIEIDSTTLGDKIFSARATAAPGYRLELDEGNEEQNSPADEADDELAGEFAAIAQRSEELKAALADAVAREDYDAADKIKRQIDGAA